MLSAEYGEAAYECADAYYYYGKALLEMARTEAGVFGNALDGGRIIGSELPWLKLESELGQSVRRSSAGPSKL